MRTNIIKSVIFFLLSIFTLNAYADGEIIKWMKLTSYDNIPEGEYVIAGNVNGGDIWYALPNAKDEEENKFKSIPLSLEDDNITSEVSNNMIWHIVPAEENFYYIKSGDNYLQNATNTSCIVSIYPNDHPNLCKWQIHKTSTHTTGKGVTSTAQGLACYANNSTEMVMACVGSYWPTKDIVNISGINNCEVVLYQKIQGYERTDGLAADKLGTICLPYNVEAEDRKGAEFYSIAYKDGNNLILYQETGTLVAGKPYIFVASSADPITLTYSGERANEASHSNGLYGSYTEINPFASADDIYIIHENSIQMAANNSGIPANRAYIKMSEVPTSAPAAKQGKIMTLGADGYIINNGTTGITSHTINSKPTAIYNLSGQKVSSTYKGITIKNGRKSLQ